MKLSDLLQHRTQIGRHQVPTWVLIATGLAAVLLTSRGVITVTTPRLRPDAPVEVLIDPGHGGQDPGAINPDGIAERDEVMKAGLTLKHLLAMQGIRGRLTRQNNTSREPSFRERTQGPGRIYVSLHMDCWELFSKRLNRVVPCVGWWVFFGDQPGSQALARSIAERMQTNPLVNQSVRVRTHLDVKDERTGERGLYINSFANGPAVLVELGRVRRLSREQRISLMQSVLEGLLPHLRPPAQGAQNG